MTCLCGFLCNPSLSASGNKTRSRKAQADIISQPLSIVLFTTRDCDSVPLSVLLTLAGTLHAPFEMAAQGYLLSAPALHSFVFTVHSSMSPGLIKGRIRVWVLVQGYC